VIRVGKPALLPGKPAIFSDTGSIMKFLPKTIWEPAYQGTQPHSGSLSGTHPNTSANHSFFHPFSLAGQALRHAPRPQPNLLYHLFRLAISALSPVFLGKTTLHLPEKAEYRNMTADHPAEVLPPQAINEIGIRWIKSDRQRQYQASTFTCNLQTNSQQLAGLSILCIGGRAALYPQYRELIEAAGGQFSVYRGSEQGDIHYLATLLIQATIVLCPVDCISHEDFSTIRWYCQSTDTPCFLLQRSDLATFGKAVEILSRYDSRPQESDISGQSQST